MLCGRGAQRLVGQHTFFELCCLLAQTGFALAHELCEEGPKLALIVLSHLNRL